jgi:hypothetical protein
VRLEDAHGLADAANPARVEQGVHIGDVPSAASGTKFHREEQLRAANRDAYAISLAQPLEG